MVVKGPNSEAVRLPEHTVCTMSTQCILGPKVTIAAQGPFHTMPGHSTGSTHILFLGVTTFNVSIMFYMLCNDIRVTKSIPWECPCSTWLLCFTRCARMPGNQVGSLGVPTFHVSIVFTRFERMPGNKVDSLGVPTFKVSIVFYALWEDAG
jgi:hypothetical protein